MANARERFIASQVERNRQQRSAEARRERGEAEQWRRDVNTGLRSLLPRGIDPPGGDISGLTGVSWPGGRERYQHANHPLNEASAWPALGSQRMDIDGKWETTGGPNIYSGNFPMYPTWTGGMGLIGDDGSQGYTERDNLQYKWGWPTDFLETGSREAAEQRANFPLGEFSGMDFPPRPLPYDADEFVDTPIEMYQPAKGTEYTPMENIEYDALHLMNPYDAGEFGEDVNINADDKTRYDNYINRGLQEQIGELMNEDEEIREKTFLQRIFGL